MSQFGNNISNYNKLLRYPDLIPQEETHSKNEKKTFFTKDKHFT